MPFNAGICWLGFWPRHLAGAPGSITVGQCRSRILLLVQEDILQEQLFLVANSGIDRVFGLVEPCPRSVVQG